MGRSSAIHVKVTMKITNKAVREAFDKYPDQLRSRLLELRAIILETAKETEGVGELEETLKWSEPAYLTSKSKSGSTIRIAPLRKSGTNFAMFVNCKTSLIDTFRELYPKTFNFEGNRALVFASEKALPEKQLKHCIALALTYHRHKLKGLASK